MTGFLVAAILLIAAPAEACSASQMYSAAENILNPNWMDSVDQETRDAHEETWRERYATAEAVVKRELMAETWDAWHLQAAVGTLIAEAPYHGFDIGGTRTFGQDFWFETEDRVKLFLSRQMTYTRFHGYAGQGRTVGEHAQMHGDGFNEFKVWDEYRDDVITEPNPDPWIPEEEEFEDHAG
jgi:hypothetical protein